MGGLDQAGLRGRSPALPQVRRPDAYHFEYRQTVSGRGGRERILCHCGLWDDAAARAPPGQHEAVQEEELLYVSDDEDSRQWLE